MLRCLWWPLVSLALVGTHIAAGGFPSPGTRLAALVGRQKVATEVTAAGGIAGVECWAPPFSRAIV